MSTLTTTDDKQALAAELAVLEREIHHHNTQLKSYVSTKLVDDFMHLETEVESAADPELSIKLFNLRVKIVGLENKQQEKSNLPNINIVIDLGDGDSSGVSVSASKPADKDTIDVDAEEVLMGSFSSLDVDDL